MQHSPPPSQPDALVDPWVTCFLTSMVIRFLDCDATASGQVDYHRVIGVVEGFDHIRDPKAFLLDSNNWVPHAVLRELIRCSEVASGRKDITYRAALGYFASIEGRQPALIETIARYLDDVDAVVRCSKLWATAYSNYLEMQAFARRDEARILYILVRFLPPVDPMIGNNLLVKGNIEGFSKLYPFVESVSCQEEYSQLRLTTVLAEFGDRYLLVEEKKKGTADRWAIKERATGAVIALARSQKFGKEAVEGWQAGEALACDRSGAEAADGVVLRIERGGILRQGPLEYPLREGAIFNAPYTRYRFDWQERANRAIEQNPKDAMSRRLFDHLLGLQSTQRRTLSIFIRNRALLEENAHLREELYGRTETGGMSGKSRAFQDLLGLARTVALTDATVLLTGETGTGKERTARLIHHLSPRRAGRFLAVNCGALVESLLESELFGHERGAFSGAVAQKKGKFEQADGGTLFLDEIGEVSPAMQVKLLRVLQEREFQRVGGQQDIKVDVRIITATNQDLPSLVADRKFRQDLFYRLHVFPIRVPPLRERVEDIPIIAAQIIARHAAAQKKNTSGLHPEALQIMLKYPWPGNIRELENILERAITLAAPKATLLGPEYLPSNVREAQSPISGAGLEEVVERVEWPLILQALKSGKGLTGLLKRIEWGLIQRAIKENSGNKTHAARLLGRTYRWLRKAETEMPQP
jgi:DNA-binding NtrC family response regulator